MIRPDLTWLVGDACQCSVCERARSPFPRFMSLCPTCGNKRCPKAEDHRYRCSGSNAGDAIREVENPCTCGVGESGYEGHEDCCKRGGFLFVADVWMWERWLRTPLLLWAIRHPLYAYAQFVHGVPR